MKNVLVIMLLVGALSPLLGGVALAAPQSESPRVGFIGCSNTIRTFEEADALGVEDNYWPGRTTGERRHPYGGGVLDVWADPLSEEWEKFNQYMSEYPNTTDVVWQLCEHFRNQTTASQEDIDNALEIAERVENDYPNVSLHVISLGTPTTCRRAGANAAEIGENLADFLSTQGPSNVVRGPIMPILQPEHLLGDGCHPNAAGGQFHLAVLNNYFAF